MKAMIEKCFITFVMRWGLDHIDIDSSPTNSQ